MTTYTKGAAGTLRRRIFALDGVNPVTGEAPCVTFHEEEVVALADGNEARVARTRGLTVAFTPGASVPLRDPVSDAIIGSITHEQIFAAFYALGRSAQESDDAAQIAAAARAKALREEEARAAAEQAAADQRAADEANAAAAAAAAAAARQRALDEAAAIAAAAAADINS